MKAFIIYLSEREHSAKHATVMYNQLKEFNHDVELFEGVPGNIAVNLAAKERRMIYPFGIKSTVLEEDDIQNYIKPELWKLFSNDHHYSVVKRTKYNDEEIEKISSPGVIGCFYSHYNLWKKCIDLNEPIMIFEDDVIFFRNFDEVEWDEVLVVSLGKTSYNKEPYKTYLEDPKPIARAVDWRNTPMPGCSGYAIHPAAAKKLVKTYRNFFLPADHAINNFVCKIQITTKLMGRDMKQEEGNISSIRTKGDPW